MKTYTLTSVLGAAVLLVLLEARLGVRGLARFETT